jgi:hypothetical protein
MSLGLLILQFKSTGFLYYSDGCILPYKIFTHIVANTVAESANTKHKHSLNIRNMKYFWIIYNNSFTTS